MAIFNSILFHRARKSVGNVTLYALKEQNVVRAKGIHRRDRKSLAQLKQRVRMKAVREVGSHVAARLLLLLAERRVESFREGERGEDARGRRVECEL